VMDPNRLAAIKALKPTPGPWHIGQGRSDVLCEDGILDAEGDAVSVHCGRSSGMMSQEDEEFCVSAADPEYGLQALAAEVERLQERERPNPALSNGYGCSVCGDCAVPGKPYCPNCGRRLEWA